MPTRSRALPQLRLFAPRTPLTRLALACRLCQRLRPWFVPEMHPECLCMEAERSYCIGPTRQQLLSCARDCFSMWSSLRSHERCDNYPDTGGRNEVLPFCQVNP
jgi:hypothetical protein